MRAVCWSTRLVLASLALAVVPSSRSQSITRQAATTLQLPAEAPAFGFRTERILGTLTFSQPVSVVAPPREANRLFVVEKPGRIMVVRDQAQPSATVFLDLRSRVGNAAGELGLLALAFHPQYAENGYFYVWYTTSTTTEAGTGLHNRLARFSVSATDPNVADPDSGVPLITQFDQASNHNGGELKFGPDGYLYLSLGDEGGANDTLQNSQRITKDFFAGILRIDVDRRPGSLAPNPHPAVHAGTYAIPKDNPFVGASRFNGAPVDPAAVRTEFWAVGLRNPWRMSFDTASGALWVGDVGQGAREEINVVTRGGNYGWSYREGTLVGPRPSPPAEASFVEPVYDYVNTGNSSITGGLVYRDVQLSQLEGAYVFADFGSGEISALRRAGDGSVTVWPLTRDAGISSFAMNPRDGQLIMTDLIEGVLKRLTYSGTQTGTPFPETLSATGAFSSLSPLTPQPGLVPYTPNVSFWSDHAIKARWFALQDDTSTFGFSPQGNWRLPTGSVWVKQFDLELTRGDPSTARRVETRFIVKTAGGIYGLSYRWNEAQTEATLVPESGASQSFTVVEDGVSRAQSWRFPSRSECFACHTPEAGHVLSFNTRQLNRTHPYPGGAANQITALAAAGYLDTTPPAPAELPALVSPTDTSHSVESRARAYLEVNCSQCHRPGGATLGNWDARATTPLGLARIVNAPLSTSGNDDANRVIVPGDATHSRIYQRMTATGGATRMPPIATREFDRAGEQLILDWIAELATPKPASRLTNLSGRALVGSGENVLIPGFVVEGSSPRRVLIRAVGPGLAAFDVRGFVPRPRMTLYSGPTALGTNQGWNSATNAAEIRGAAEEVGAFALTEGGADSAMVVTLQPGSYTTVIADADGTSGIALFEVYDAESGTAVRLSNTSVRARVGSGAGVIIPGLVVSPGAFKTVLIRAVGPGLREFDVEDFQAKPVLTLFAGAEAFRTNAGWTTAEDPRAITDASAAVGAFPLDPNNADSAMLVTLSPGVYTLHISSGNDTTGVALVEVYEVLP